MKIEKTFGILLLFLCTISFMSCSDDEQQDKVETIKMFVSAETGSYKPWGSPNFLECMLVKEEHENGYKPLYFLGIIGFEYEKRHEYELMVEKTTLINPPADGSAVSYRLIKILSKTEIKLTGAYAVEVVWAVDAERKEIVETDLQNNLPVPVGGGYIITSNASIPSVSLTWTIVNSNNFPVAIGSLPVSDVITYQQIPELPASYKLLPPEGQIVAYKKWTFEFNGIKYPYDVFLISIPGRYNDLRPLLYEDLTGYYKTKYPNAGVKGVVRAQILNYKP